MKLEKVEKGNNMDNSVLVNYYKINDKDYLLINEIDFNDKHYVYLVNENDPKDILVRSLKGDNLIPLETEQELIEVLKQFVK